MKPELNLTETYLVHNCIMGQCHKELIDRGRADLAAKLQELALDRDGAFVLHSLIQITLDIAYLDQETEPK